jgi:hypothetical protein
MTRNTSSTVRLLTLAMFTALALSCARAGDLPRNYILVNWSDVSEMRIDEEVGGQYVPAAPDAVDLISADPPCEEVLELANQLNLTPSRIYDKVQPFQQEKRPLTRGGKFKLAIINTVDPFNMATEAADAATSAWTSGSKSAYGTGSMAFAKRFGTDMADELSGEFFQTFAFPAIFGQDPHYHRDVDNKTPRRIRYALTQVFVTRSDKGRRMFNYGEVLGNFAAASVGNLYHPDRDTGFGPTSARIGVSIASDAAWNLFTEFWPDVSKHINFRMMFLRRLAERAAQPN